MSNIQPELDLIDRIRNTIVENDKPLKTGEGWSIGINGSDKQGDSNNDTHRYVFKRLETTQRVFKNTYGMGVSRKENERNKILNAEIHIQ